LLDLEIDVTPIAAPSTDRYRIAATTEFEKGEIDQPLWDRAFAQAKGDRKAAIDIYLPARATALRVLKREQAPAPRPQPAADVEKKPATATSSKWADRDEPRSEFRRARFMALGIKVGAAVGVCVVVGVFVAYVYPGFATSTSGNAAAWTAANAAPQPAKRVAAKPSASEAPAEANAKATAVHNLIAKIEELRIVDNWNVLVLYAQEWTRQEPGNAAAWIQLSEGYERLKQFADARDAATTAVTLAPKDARYWRAVARLDQELDRPEDALRAFNEAAALDDKDVHSLVQAGLLDMQLARVPEAKDALAKAMALSPDDPTALCLKSLVAGGQVAPKQITAARQNAYEGACRDGDAPKNAPVAANNPPPKATAVANKR
jgi:hypothetical protein